MNNYICVNDFKIRAAQVLPDDAAGFFNSGADDEQTMRDNESSYKEWRFMPKVLRDVSDVNLSTSVLGQNINMPICIAPTSLSKMATPGGELDAVKAASNYSTVYTLSSMSTSSIEEVAKVDAIRWFQLYVFKDRSMVSNLVKRAEKNGYSALVLTVDLPALGKRIIDIRNKFTLPSNLSLKNFEEEHSTESYTVKGKRGSGMSELTSTVYDSTLSWKDLDWLKSITNLPIILKGIINPEMALEAIKYGVKAIIVSNHGGRQLNSVPATINALPQIVAAVSGRCEVYIDGGVRNGNDVAKALALGAKAVFIGRPIIWGLACGGQRGAEKVLEILRDELELAMKLLGVSSVEELRGTPNLVTHISSIISRL